MKLLIALSRSGAFSPNKAQKTSKTTTLLCTHSAIPSNSRGLALILSRRSLGRQTSLIMLLPHRVYLYIPAALKYIRPFAPILSRPAYTFSHKRIRCEEFREHHTWDINIFILLLLFASIQRENNTSLWWRSL